MSNDPPTPAAAPSGFGRESANPAPSLPLPAAMEQGQRALCHIDEIADGASKGFPPPAGGFTGLFAVRQGASIVVYVNACPHIGTPLDWTADRFLSADASRIVCATHGAEFRISDGLCLRGPCAGERLEAVAAEIRDGTVFVPEDAGL
jgi:nitrite reductase/ring-hydroxylating ferredoxin subunit